MAQQAAEKAIKAVILLGPRPFDLVHDLDVLGNQLPADVTLPVSSKELSWLTDLESSARYPDEGEVITSDDAEKSIDLARRVVDAVRDHVEGLLDVE